MRFRERVGPKRHLQKTRRAATENRVTDLKPTTASLGYIKIRVSLLGLNTESRPLRTASLRRSRCRGKSQRLHQRIMQCRPHLLNLYVLPGRVYAIRQQHHKKLPIRIDPDRRSGKTRVPKAVRRKIMPARSAFGRHRPAQRARAAGKLLRRREL